MNYDFDRAQEHFRNRMMFTTGPHELQVLQASRKNPASYQIVDVRYPDDFAAGHVPGAINLPRGSWAAPRALNKDAVLYLYCYNAYCHLAAEAAHELVRQGYRVIEVEGGWDGWVDFGFAVEPEAKSHDQAVARA